METQENTNINTNTNTNINTNTIKDTENNMSTQDSNKSVYDGCGCSNPNIFSQTFKEGFDNMFKNIKNCAIALFAVAAIAFSGCQTMPSIESIDRVGGAFGFTTAYVLNKQVNMTNVTTRAVIVDVVTKVDNYLPATNETCSTKWTPMIKELTDKYVANGGLTQAQADRVVKDFKYITTLLDKYIDNKGIRPYQELVDAFVHSFSTKFLQNFKVEPNADVSVSANAELYDRCVDKELSSLISK